jgi:hypothetical protein
MYVPYKSDFVPNKQDMMRIETLFKAPNILKVTQLSLATNVILKMVHSKWFHVMLEESFVFGNSIVPV